MHQKSSDVLRRSDRVLVGALIVVLAAVSAAVGAAAAYRPHANEVRTAVVIAQPAAPVAMVQESDGALPAALVAARSASEKAILEKLMAEHRCLSEALYYEARGEGLKGQKAVAEVIFHRMRTGNYGHSICAVVYEGANQPGCQFSFTCDGELALHKTPGAWTEAQVVAARILTGEERLNDATGGATSFHAVSVSPDWAPELQKTVQIGNHVFYKDPPRSGPM
ncbi:MAG: cell wall hydrolase [Alphaproteobacteria bacterium]|nr:cell wall hydrolase [Alphaproteobacteria bacterium]